MQNATAMNIDIKALLTLLLLKSGTSSKEIQTVLMVAAASRVMVAEESAVLPRTGNGPELARSNISTLRPCAQERADMSAHAGEADLLANDMHSDIKALLTLVLLQNGVSSKDIQTTLRLAAASRLSMTEDRAETSWPDGMTPLPANRTSELHSIAPKQALRNDHLAPISMREFAA